MTISLHPPARGNTAASGFFGIPEPATPLINMLEYRPASLNQPFRLREALKAGKPLIAGVLGLGSPDVVRIFANSGFDLAWLDWEHNAYGPQEMAELIKGVQYAGEGHCAALVRLPSFGHEYISWALDAGASGIVVPHTETVEQAKWVVHHSRFLGYGGLRSFPPIGMAAGILDGPPNKTVPQIYSENAAVILQIESVKGCENAMDIAAVDGVDALMLGTGDLRADLGLHGFDGDEPEFLRCLDLFTAAARKYNLPMMAVTKGPLLPKRIAQGFSIFLQTADVWELSAGLTTTVKGAREVAARMLKLNGIHENNGIYTAPL